MFRNLKKSYISKIDKLMYQLRKNGLSSGSQIKEHNKAKAIYEQRDSDT